MTLRVGLVGAGPWASRVHGPGIAASDRTELAGVWARRPAAAETLATALGTRAYADVDALFADCDAVAFAVPPGVQAELATRAAAAGRHLILDKPIAADLPAAERLAAAVTSSGVRTAVFFTCRYTDRGRAFVAAARQGSWDGARAAWVSNALLRDELADSRWRHERGALWDVGPHAVELLDAALGPVTTVRAATRTPRDLVQLQLEHRGGAVSQVTLTLRVPVTAHRDGVDLYGPSGTESFTFHDLTPAPAYASLLTALTTPGTAPPCDVHRGLQIHHTLTAAEALMT